MRRFTLNRSQIYSIGLIITLIDQLSKYYAVNLLENENRLNLIPNIINLNLVKNTGAAFSLFPNSTFLLSIVSLIVSIVLFIWIYKDSPMRLWKGMAIGFMLGGSAGNGLDRLRLGYVYDFLELIPINFPIFNAADIAINIAIFCFIVDTLTNHQRFSNH